MDAETIDVLERGVRLFNDAEFFEAHDVWEEHWLNVSGDERRLFQGLIQIAASLYKLQLGNARGMSLLLADAVETLAGITTGGYGLDVPALRALAAKWKKSAEAMVLAGKPDYRREEMPRLDFARPRPA